jgi:acyl-CoA reductase-like NAD-dependent aldehyde dehydrogenase
MSTHYKVHNPYTGQLLGEYPFTTTEQTAAAVRGLKAGHLTQRALHAGRRADILHRLAELLDKDQGRLSQLITAETGKTISDSRVELERAINTAVASSEEARQISGESLDSDAYSPARGRIGVVCWRPLGTVLCITPFNFPLNIAMHKIGPAFAAGNCVLFKPGPQNTASAQALTQLCHQAGIPNDVLQCRIPDVQDMRALVQHPDIDCINFTGGNVAADAIAGAAGYKKLLFELGGNDPLIVMPDADLDAAVNAAINQRFATAGQRCTAAKRLFIHDTVYEDFRDRLVAAGSKLKVGDPAEDDTFVGPVISTAAADEVERRIKEAVAAGATVALGNQRKGNIIYPCILENVPVDTSVVARETFGPVLPLQRFTDLDEVIAQVNNSDYGLQAGVFTQDMRIIRRLFEELEVGTLASNDGPGFRAEHFPFGGTKHSGIGREGVKYAIREMSYQKTLVI